jgi:SAM-dependent methyltransferase
MVETHDSVAVDAKGGPGRLGSGLRESGYLGMAGRAFRKIRRVSANQYNAMEARYFDLVHGTDTIGIIPINKLDVEGEIVRHGTGYQCTNAWAFRKILREIGFPKENTFVDIGSGKGKLLLLASEYGFSGVVGIEVSRRLCEVAEQNVARFRRKIKREMNVRIVQADALEYQIEDDQSVFCMFNPFDEVLLGHILENIQKSLKKIPRHAWVIYVNPQHRAVIEDHPGFVQLREFKFIGETRTIVVYSAG